MKKIVSMLVLFLLTIVSVFALSKQQAKRVYILGYNSGYDNYEPYTGYPDTSILRTALLRQMINDPNLQEFSDADKLAMANIFAEGYKKGFNDHARRIHRDPDAAWDNTRWALYGPPYG